MTCSLFTAALALAWSLPATAGPHKSDVVALLSGFEDTPSADALEAIPDAGAELVEIAGDPSISKSVRMRAVHALGWFPSDENRAFLTAVLDGEDPRMARKAVFALGNGWGEGAVPELQRALAHHDTQLRLAAVQALSSVGGEAARTALDARLGVEQNDIVKQSISTALGR